MKKDERVEAAILLVIDDQQQMNVVGHDYEIARGQRGVKRMNRAPKRLYAFAGPRQRGPLRAALNSRQNLSSSFDADRQKEKLPPAMVEFEIHDCCFTV